MDWQIPYDPALLPAGVRSRFVDNNNGCVMHVLEAGHGTPGRPCVLLLHGFPELAFSWRRQLPALAAAGFHVVAPDQRGYGRSGGADVRYDDDLLPYGFINRVADAVGLVKALGLEHVAAVIGHDYGSPVAAWCALLRPDVFRALGMMSAAFPGPPALPTGMSGTPAKGALPLAGIPESLAALPRPRKHYRWYYATREANEDMWHCPQGVHDFLRAYFHHKSADWKENRPHELAAWRAEELAKMPTYYIMDLFDDMPAAVAKEMPDAAAIAACRWLPDAELAVYAGEYERNGFQGGLNWYRSRTSGAFEAELQLFSGRTIDVKSIFISGKSDWGVYQRPGALDKMRNEACTRMLGVHLLDGAGHWVTQEQPEAVSNLLIDFLRQREG